MAALAAIALVALLAGPAKATPPKFSGAGQLFASDDVDVDTSGNVWVADTGNERVAEFSATGAFLRNLSLI
jgi:hypothetical protein